LALDLCAAADANPLYFLRHSMPESYLVKIETHKRIGFPRECPVCGEACEQTGQIRGNPSISYFGGWMYLLGLTQRIQLNIHRKCNRKVNTVLRFRNALIFGLGGIALLIVFSFDLHYLTGKLFLIVLATVLILPEVYRQVKYPPPIEFVHDSGMLEFTIKNEAYATELAKLNDATFERNEI
jgi:hypothetical protein